MSVKSLTQWQMESTDTIHSEATDQIRSSTCTVTLMSCDYITNPVPHLISPSDCPASQ